MFTNFILINKLIHKFVMGQLSSLTVSDQRNLGCLPYLHWCLVPMNGCRKNFSQKHQHLSFFYTQLHKWMLRKIQEPSDLLWTQNSAQKSLNSILDHLFRKTLSRQQFHRWKFLPNFRSFVHLDLRLKGAICLFLGVRFYIAVWVYFCPYRNCFSCS